MNLLILLCVKNLNQKLDASLFYRNDTPAATLFILVYVDDIIITGSSTSEVYNVVETLSQRFSLKDNGELSFFFLLKRSLSANGLSTKIYT